MAQWAIVHQTAICLVAAQEIWQKLVIFIRLTFYSVSCCHSLFIFGETICDISQDLLFILTQLFSWYNFDFWFWVFREWEHPMLLVWVYIWGCSYTNLDYCPKLFLWNQFKLMVIHFDIMTTNGGISRLFMLRKNFQYGSHHHTSLQFNQTANNYEFSP